MKLTGLMAAAAHHHHHQQKVGSLLLLSERDVQQCLSIKDCLAVNRKAFIALAQGKAHVPTRIGLPYQSQAASARTCAQQDDDESEKRQHRPQTSTSSSDNSTSSAAAQDWTLFKPAAYYHHQSSDDNDDNKNEEEAPSIEHDDDDTDTTLMGIKLVSVRANNPASQYKLPLVPATIVLVHAETGLVNAIVAGTYLTAARTAAGSALSTALVYQQKKLLISNNNKSNSDNNNNSSSPPPLFQHLVVFGAGLQAKLHIQAIATAMSDYKNNNKNKNTDEISPIPLVSIINRTEQRAVELKNEILGINTATSDDGHFCWARQVQTVLLDDKVAVAKTLSTANVVVTATNTIEPLWQDTDDTDTDAATANRMMMMLPHGCHIAGVGSYTPQMREVPLSTARKCYVLMDTPEARLVGDLKDLPDSHPMTLIGQALLLQQEQQNNNNDTIFVGGERKMDFTFFKSVGTAIQDVMTADMVVQRARELNIGQEIDMS